MFVYILTNQHHTVLYTGVTNNLARRVFEHKTQVNQNSFSSKYNLNKLVYYEYCPDAELAIQREKQIKSGSRIKKTNLIDKTNPNWKDLFEELEA